MSPSFFLFIFSMPIFVVDGDGYKEVTLMIVEDRQSLLPEDNGRACIGTWVGCSMYGPDRIYVLDNNGCWIWHEILHQMKVKHDHMGIFERC